MGRPMPSDPRLVYSRLLEERRADIALRERRHRTLGYGRLAAVIARGGGGVAGAGRPSLDRLDHRPDSRLRRTGGDP